MIADDMTNYDEEGKFNLNLQSSTKGTFINYGLGELQIAQ